MPRVTKWQYPSTDRTFYHARQGTTRRVREIGQKLYLSFKTAYEFSMFYVKPAGNPVKYDESQCKGA